MVKITGGGRGMKAIAAHFRYIGRQGKEEVGGKGGPSQTSVVYSYYGTFAVLLGEGEIRGIRRIWAGPVLIHDATGAADNPAAARVDFTFYPGSETQLPDPTLEAALGVGNTPAFRGWSYVVFNRLPLERFGNVLPSLTFESIGEGEERKVVIKPADTI